jgi:homoserine kinase
MRPILADPPPRRSVAVRARRRLSAGLCRASILAVSRPEDSTRQATVFAPATVANVSVGFDLLGFALDGVGDRVTVTRVEGDERVVVDSIGGVVTDLPKDPRKNTASVAVLALIDASRPGCGFRIAIDKGLPLGSGMGGSAASAVGAVVAANALVDRPLPREALLEYATEGERAATGAAHADNTAPCLFGGLTGVVSKDPLEVVRIPIPEGLRCVLVHPRMRIDTREAREVLRPSVSLGEHVEQTMHLTGLLVGCWNSDLELIRRSMRDRIVEPQRSRLIPGFDAARDAAIAAGALGFGIAGSGPSVFAWVADDPSEGTGRAVETAVNGAFAAAGLETDSWVGAIRETGAEVVAGRGAP